MVGIAGADADDEKLAHGRTPARSEPVSPDRAGACPDRAGACPDRAGACPDRAGACPDRSPAPFGSSADTEGL
ncbi:hypothetical protein EN925_32670 [Mesorhizobium sp. M7A.F.Ca.US.006.04.2.1]|nr:hypothetical protein EN990_34620 [Mesorhizobium sp. M7A.F.Ca.US.005.03.1.1]RUZ98628.1 hypothetical protein EN938_30985 [Mesorhizobium sp. M7A.F.Ca.US.001.02.1.1]RVA08623.1 hypothetical protein EN932_25220 [Mesorhizobium sp. M7A.F.Ca.US.002.01.1.1]RVA80980.1 hypothetical protein EN925_32670 [Mesorhizobium sp. M7A.F.Ca.US.006.04.2.1]